MADKVVNYIIKLDVTEYQSLLGYLDKLMEKSMNAKEIESIVALKKEIKDQA